LTAHKSIAPRDGTGGGSSAFKSRSARSLDARDEEVAPGPGAYDVALSEQRGSAWGRAARVRSAADEDGGAGPGSYELTAHKSIAPRDGTGGGSSAFKSRSARSHDARDRDVPGPGAYEVDAKPRATTPRKAVSSFGFKRPEVKQRVDDVPGPGHYETLQATRPSISSPFKSRTVQRPARAVEVGPSPSTYEPHPRSSLTRGTSAAFKSGVARFFGKSATESSSLMYDTRWHRSVTDDRGFA